MKTFLKVTVLAGLLSSFVAADTALSLNVAENATVSQGDWKYYVINGGATSIKIYNLSSDLDLYVKSGSRPTVDNWDCRPYEGGTTEEVCSVNPSEVIYVGVHGYASGSFSLIALGSGGGVTPTPGQLNNILHDRSSVSQGQWKYYTVNGGATSVKLHELSSDLDLHVKSGSRPTADDWDCRPYDGGTTEEVCSVSPNEVIYIGVYGYTSGSFTLDVEGTGGGSTPNPTPDNTIVAQAFENAVTNLSLKQGYVYWNGNRYYGIWATPDMTYCAKFVRMCFGEPGKYRDAKTMYNHFNSLQLIQSYGTPPKGAVVFYAAHDDNWNAGHVGISDGNGYQYSADSTSIGVRKRPIRNTYRARYLGYVTAELFKANH